MPPTTVALGTLAMLLAGVFALALRRRMRSPGRRSAAPAQRASLLVGDTIRSFVYRAPPSLAPGAPLLIVFHGGSGSPEQIRRQTGFEFDELADANGFAVAYPQGTGGNWNTCQKGRRNTATKRNADDVGFARALIAWFDTHHRIDRSRVFVAGFSNGGHMCFRLALEMTGEIAGFAAIAANRPAPADCKCRAASVAVPMMMFNGTADPINPYAGGMLSPYGLRSLGPVLSAEDTAASFVRPGSAHRRERVDETATADRATRVEKQAWGTATQDEVVLFTIRGGGHTIAQRRYAFPRIFGRTSTEIDAPLEIWRFFCTISANIARFDARPERESMPTG
ncbi:alpha/beta hydrolase family esterase [Burkholderia alba]|uniref:alpha/beta hydrolase family esterase n=1 Tax=Burkholderia alba TaxID=2683677 RepID=UPI002B055D7C|nr:PHB depolymerase family esterase [Burkholderia alba]